MVKSKSARGNNYKKVTSAPLQPFVIIASFDSRALIDVDVLYLSTKRLAPFTSHLLMVGLQLKGHVGKTRSWDIIIEGLIINHTIFYELEKNTVIALGKFNDKDEIASIAF